MHKTLVLTSRYCEEALFKHQYFHLLPLICSNCKKRVQHLFDLSCNYKMEEKLSVICFLSSLFYMAICSFLFPTFNILNLDVGDGFGHSDGANFTPHVITINIGEVCHEWEGI